MVTDALVNSLSYLLVAVGAGAVIGLERSFHGRPAGFRTHVLVCLASSLLMLVTQGHWLTGGSDDAVRVDPMRMAQGVMTGIGFLGAGVIMKEGLSVRGLTTAASIWTTAAIGVLAGVGLFDIVALATALTLGTLTVFRRIESIMPTQLYAYHRVRFARDAVMPEPELRALLAELGFSVANVSYRLVEDGRRFEYGMVLRSRDAGSTGRLATRLSGISSVVGFRIAPTGD